MKFEDWLNEVYLPEQIVEPSSKELSALRFAFEEGFYYGSLELAKKKELELLSEFARSMYFNYKYTALNKGQMVLGEALYRAGLLRQDGNKLYPTGCLVTGEDLFDQDEFNLMIERGTDAKMG